jgi:hypothetical protein
MVNSHAPSHNREQEEKCGEQLHGVSQAILNRIAAAMKFSVCVGNSSQVISLPVGV